MIGHDRGKPDTAAWVGVDVGGTKILAGVVAADGTVVEVVHAETPARSDAPQVVEDTIVRAVQRLAARQPVAGVGVGAGVGGGVGSGVGVGSWARTAMSTAARGAAARDRLESMSAGRGARRDPGANREDAAATGGKRRERGLAVENELAGRPRGE